MTINTDFHSHVARSSALQMAQAACQKGLRVLGLSEHIFQMSEARPLLCHMQLEGPVLTFAHYIEKVRSAAQRFRCDVRLGMEVDFIPEKHEHIEALLQDYSWDFLIGSVHEVDGIQFERNKQWSRAEGEALWLRYFALLREAIHTSSFSLISHPVRMRAVNPHVPRTIDKELEQLAAEATRANIALEINGYDALTYPTLVRRLAKACTLHQTPISVGSDAHTPREVAQAHGQTQEILREAAIKKVRIWNKRIPEEYQV